MNNKLRLLALVDSVEYVKSEVYQSQLFEELEQQCSVTFVELQEIVRKTTNIDLSTFDGIFCALKIRNTLKYITDIEHFLFGYRVVIQDFDPWVSFIDSSPYKGCYEQINSRLDVKQFLVSAFYWAQKLRDIGLSAQAQRVGMKSSYIASVIPFGLRSRQIEFRGSRHELRVLAHEKLRSAGVDVPWLPAVKPYTNFLSSINDLQIWCHNESPVVVDGNICSANSLWPKSIEVLSRGCFLLRNAQDEAVSYGLSELPTVFLFSDVEQAKHKLDEIKSLSSKECDERIDYTLSFLRAQAFWPTYVKNLLDTISS